MLNEGDFWDNVKSRLWKAKNLYNKHGVEYRNTRQKNPYTYNKRYLHKTRPEYNSPEYNAMTSADDARMADIVYTSIERMRRYLSGKTNDDKIIQLHIDWAKDACALAEEYGFTKQGQYLKDLLDLAINKYNEEQPRQ